MTAPDALALCTLLPVRTVIDIGPGDGVHLREFRDRGMEVSAVSPHAVAGFDETAFRGRFPEILSSPEWRGDRFDLVWSSHCLEHQSDPQVFLSAIHDLCHEGSFIAITVPPRKDLIVSGHLTLWNAGLLLQHLIIAGFDCSNAAVKTYGYNVSVVVPYRRIPEALPRNRYGEVDLSRIGHYLPAGIEKDARGAYDGWIIERAWSPAALVNGHRERGAGRPMHALPDARSLHPNAANHRPALVLDWGGGPILDHIAESLHAGGWAVLRAARGGDASGEAVRLIEERSPALCITRQRLYPTDRALATAIAACDCETLFVDLGVWPHYATYVMDTAGENAASSLVGRLAALLADPAISERGETSRPLLESMRETLRERAARASSQLDELGLAGLGDFSLVILQRAGDQVLIHDAPPRWREPADVARAAIAEAERTGRFVVVKPHPMSPDLPGIPCEGPHHRVTKAFRNGASNDRQFAWLIANAANAITVNSTGHFQTLALGLPTVCLGRGWFSGNEVVVEAHDLSGTLEERRRFDAAEPYLLHLLSRQLAIPGFANPDALTALVEWVRLCRNCLAEAGAPPQAASAAPVT